MESRRPARPRSRPAPPVARLPHRPLHVAQGDPAGAAARRRGLGGPPPLDPHQLEIPRPEHLGERGPLHFLRPVIEGSEVLPLGESLGEFRLALFDPFEKPEFEEDDGTGDDREKEEHQENELDDRPGEPDVLEHLGVEQAVRGRCYREAPSRIGHRREHLQGNYIFSFISQSFISQSFISQSFISQSFISQSLLLFNLLDIYPVEKYDDDVMETTRKKSQTTKKR